MTFKSCDMVYHPEADAHESVLDWPVGHFHWSVSSTGQRYIWMILPRQDNDAGAPCCIPIRPVSEGETRASWAWDGNLERPTLTPSVLHAPSKPESPYHWHGFVTAGRMVGC